MSQPNRRAELTTDWGDGTHTFRLPIGQLRELQEKTNCGPMELLNRMIRGTWRLDDVRETIRLGLVGGGMAPIDALALVARYVDPPRNALAEAVPMAQAVISVLLFGGEEDNPLGKERAEEETSSSQTGVSPSPASTEPGQ